MFKGLGALPQRAEIGWVYTQTLLAQFIIPDLTQVFHKKLTIIISNI